MERRSKQKIYGQMFVIGTSRTSRGLLNNESRISVL